jgi:hypothetical protein
MTYIDSGWHDGHHLHRDDLSVLVTALQRYADSEQPGAATIFVYAVESDIRALFWDFIDDLALATDLSITAGWVAHYRDKRNVAAVLSIGLELDHDLPAGIHLGR